MRIFILTVVGLVGTWLIQSCNEEVELIGEFRETAVVYGLLDQSDSIHTLKITRAFIGPGNALQIAQVPDSSYFDAVDATITEIGGMNRTWTLNDTVLDTKDTNGVFYAPEQRVYYFQTSSDQPLDGNATYRLDIVINNGLFAISGQTELIKGMSLSSVTNGSLKFVQNSGTYVPEVIPVNVGNAHRVNLQMEVEYNEFTNGAQVNTKSFIWKWNETDVTPLETKPFSANGETFFTLMANSCASSSSTIDQRTMGDITITATGASEDLVNYILVNQPSSSLAQNNPTFTNLTATNNFDVVGIFSARTKVKVVRPFFSPIQSFIRSLDKNTTRELCEGSISGPYFFCSHNPADIQNAESFACE